MRKMICPFNEGWRFTKLPKTEGADCLLPVWEKDFDDSAWEQVCLPHTYNDLDGVNGKSAIVEGGESYYRGLTCYRKTFTGEFAGKRVFAEFGAANTVAAVYVNGVLAGRHEGGYAMFRVDITDYLLPGENVMAVTVSNAPSDYISPIINMGDFSKMGGLYREASLVVTEAVHIDLMDYGASGVYITPKNITEETADVDICVKLANDGKETSELTVSVSLLDMQGAVVATAEQQVCLLAGEKGKALLKTAVNDPVFWNGRENPYLYKAVVTVSVDGVAVDERCENFGIRTFYVDKEKGFFLNGKHLRLNGAGCHQDSYEAGWAMTDAQRERDYQMMADMGATAVRLVHYQHDPYDYELCDRLGLAAWAEVGAINQFVPDEFNLELTGELVDNVKQQLTELIRQNYNHPSICFWGVSNEQHQMDDAIFDLYGQLSQYVAREDSTRLRVYADNQFYGSFLQLPLDAVGCNRYFGWYKEGAVENFGPWLDKYHNKLTDLPVCVSEYGGGGALGQYMDNPSWQKDIDIWGKRHYENYQSRLHERIWEQLAPRQYLWATFIWCMFDFASANREEGNTTGQNDKGMVTRDRRPKDVYYFYQSAWNPEPMVHLTQKKFFKRPAPVPQVKAYSNAERLELFVNGQSQGFGVHTQTLPTVFVWENIDLRPGENQVAVKAYFADGKVLEDSTVWSKE